MSSGETLELHVWGPAFGLPSIDAPCLAAILYLKKCLQLKTWVLLPTSDPAISPHGELPALRDGKLWIAGYRNVVQHLRLAGNGHWDLDRQLDKQQHADCAALSAFIESRGQPLLDLSLYVSSDNYVNCTRQALGDILAWPESWMVPHQLRARAKTRSDHLGLSSLDVDTAQQDKGQEKGLNAHIPKSLRKPKQTVTSVLGRSQQKTRFRLEAVTADFLEPLADMLDNKQFLLGDKLTSVDCLAIGYLALMQSPQLPQAWIKEALQKKYNRLGGWARDTVTVEFGSSVSVSMLPELARSTQPKLPWEVPTPRTFQHTLQSVVESCMNSIPFLGTRYVVTEVGKVKDDRDRVRRKHARLTSLQRRRDLYVQVLASTFTVTGMVAWMAWKGILPYQRLVSRPRTRGFGQAGTLLGLG